MKNLLVSLCLVVVLTIFGLFVFKQTTEAQNNVVANLLDLPAPPPLNSLFENNSANRTEKFFSKTNPPRDDAPTGDILEYWKAQNQFDAKRTYTIKPSAAQLEKIFADIEENPENLSEFINVLPENQETAAFVKRFYDKMEGDEDTEKYQTEAIKKWLTYHTDYFSDELFRAAQKSTETAEYVTNQDEVLGLAHVDWDRARPLLENMLTSSDKPVSQTLARWAFYQHALAEKDSGDIEKYRRELQETVEDKNGKPGNRDLAMDALIESGDYEGRDDWYYSLLSDETLFDLRVNGSTYTGLTTILNHSPSEKYVAKMIELAGSANPAVRSAAVRNLTTLLDEKNPDVVRALLPWLENPDWAKQAGNERQMLVNALANFEMPESVPGLIGMLNEKVTRQAPARMNANTMSNSTMTNSVMTVTSYNSYEMYPFRNAAINALAKQKDMRAVSALRMILPEVEPYERGNVVKALLACRGFSVAEQIEALESVAKNVNLQDEIQPTETVRDTIDSTSATVYTSPSVSVSSGIMANTATAGAEMRYGIKQQAYNPADIKFVLGGQLVAVTEVSDELVAGLIDRIEVLDAKDPHLAFVLRKIMQNWQGAAVNSLLLKDLKNGKAETDAVVKLLSLRKKLREKQSNDVFDIRNGKPSALGISACLLEENSDYDAILASENNEAKTAMLACARLIRANLPVQKVAENLRSSDKLLALAAERYLESEDSPEARRIVLSLHPNEAKILGATTYFASGDKSAVGNRFLMELFSSVGESPSVAPYYLFYNDNSVIRATEQKLQKEVMGNQELLGVYAYDKNFIRIYKDKAIFSWEEDDARYRERLLDETEFNRFKNHLASQRADEMPPFLSVCDECENKELLMLGRQGGRRVFVKSRRPPIFFTEIDKMFADMRKQPARLHYWLEKDIPGLEILLADDNLQAQTVWKNGDDFRVLIEDVERRKQIEKELEKMDEADAEKADDANYDYEKSAQARQNLRASREYENFAWYKVGKEKLADSVAQPPQIEYLPTRDGFPAQATNQQWKARAANLEIRAGEDGLYKIIRNQLTKIQNGYYTAPLVTPNGRWAIATKYGDEDGGAIVRVNLATNKEFKVKIPEQFPRYEAVAFIPSVNKTLIFAGSYDDGEESEYAPESASQKYGKYFLLDAETGLTQPAAGDIRPFAQQTFRPLQPAANADEFWAAINDEKKNETQIGIYNGKTFIFKSLLKIPQIQFDSMNMWADARENKIYFVYQGHLLSLPIPAEKGKNSE